MAVTDLWHRADRAPCPACRARTAGTPTARHGRGLRWRVTVGDHPTRAFAIKADAEAWAAELRTRATARPDTIGPLVDLWLKGKAGLSSGGYEQCRRAAERVKVAWGAVPVDEADRAELQAWIAGLTVVGKARSAEPHPASQTVKAKAAQALSGALRIAQERGQITANPAAGLRYGKPSARDARFLEWAELEALADASIWPAAIWMLGTGGYRATESLRLTVGSVHAERKRVRVTDTKGKKLRDVPILPSVLDMLDLDRPKDAPLLIHPAGSKTDRKTLRNNVVVPAARRAGLGAVTTHDLRHTTASLAIASGADVKMVQEMLGHASAAMTLDLYGHLWVSGLDDVAAKMQAEMAAQLGLGP